MVHQFIIYSNRALTKEYLNALFMEVWTGPGLDLTTGRTPPDLAEAYDALNPHDVFLTFQPRGGKRLTDEDVADLRDAVVKVKDASKGTGYCPINGGQAITPATAKQTTEEHKHNFRFWKNK